MAGALTGSMVGSAVKGGWGTTYILIDPSVFRPLENFKDDVKAAIDKLKSMPKANGVNEIYFAGEQSHFIMEKNLEAGEIEVSDNLLKQLRKLGK